MKKHISKFILSLTLLMLIFFIFLPYFTSSFLGIRQEKEKEENYQKFLKEELARKKTEKELEQRIYLMGKFDPAQKEGFVLVPEQYTLSENKMYLRKETYEAYLQMKRAADIDFIDLKIASATRNFDSQRKFWDNQWSGATIVDGKNLAKSIPLGLERFEKILEYSAPPGTSRHHWGTDIDINGANPSYFETESGEKEYEWLTKNAYLFGFCQTYNKKNSDKKTSYNEEKWHWSYLPLSKNFTQEYKNLIKDEDIKGFLGDEYVPALNLINDYVLAINPDCI